MILQKIVKKAKKNRETFVAILAQHCRYPFNLTIFSHKKMILISRNFDIFNQNLGNHVPLKVSNFCSFLVDVTDNNEENWEKYLGDKDDAHSSIMIRFPDGNRVTKDIPCSSQFQVRISHFLLLFS